MFSQIIYDSLKKHNPEQADIYAKAEGFDPPKSDYTPPATFVNLVSPTLDQGAVGRSLGMGAEEAQERAEERVQEIVPRPVSAPRPWWQRQVLMTPEQVAAQSEAPDKFTEILTRETPGYGLEESNIGYGLRLLGVPAQAVQELALTALTEEVSPEEARQRISERTPHGFRPTTESFPAPWGIFGFGKLPSPGAMRVVDDPEESFTERLTERFRTGRGLVSDLRDMPGYVQDLERAPTYLSPEQATMGVGLVGEVVTPDPVLDLGVSAGLRQGGAALRLRKTKTNLVNGLPLSSEGAQAVKRSDNIRDAMMRAEEDLVSSQTMTPQNARDSVVELSVTDVVPETRLRTPEQKAREETLASQIEDLRARLNEAQRTVGSPEQITAADERVTELEAQLRALPPSGPRTPDQIDLGVRLSQRLLRDRKALAEAQAAGSDPQVVATLVQRITKTEAQIAALPHSRVMTPEQIVQEHVLSRQISQARGEAARLSSLRAPPEEAERLSGEIRSLEGRRMGVGREAMDRPAVLRERAPSFGESMIAGAGRVAERVGGSQEAMRFSPDQALSLQMAGTRLRRLGGDTPEAERALSDYPGVITPRGQRGWVRDALHGLTPPGSPLRALSAPPRSGVVDAAIQKPVDVAHGLTDRVSGLTRPLRSLETLQTRLATEQAKSAPNPDEIASIQAEIASETARIQNTLLSPLMLGGVGRNNIPAMSRILSQAPPPPLPKLDGDAVNAATYLRSLKKWWDDNIVHIPGQKTKGGKAKPRLLPDGGKPRSFDQALSRGIGYQQRGGETLEMISDVRMTGRITPSQWTPASMQEEITSYLTSGVKAPNADAALEEGYLVADHIRREGGDPIVYEILDNGSPLVLDRSMAKLLDDLVSSPPPPTLRGKALEIIGLANSLATKGMLTGWFLPNLRYHSVNILTAPAIIAATRGLGGVPAALFEVVRRTVDGSNPKDFPQFQQLSEMLSPSRSTADVPGMVLAGWQAQVRAMRAGAQDSRKAALLNKLTETLDPRLPGLWSDFANASDAVWREAVLLAELRRGKTGQEALRSANEALLDYGAIPEAEMRSLGKVLLFYAFTRQMTEATLRSLVERPGDFRRIADIHRELQGNEQWDSLADDDRLRARIYRRAGEIWGPENPQMGSVVMIYNILAGLGTMDAARVLEWLPMTPGTNVIGSMLNKQNQRAYVPDHLVNLLQETGLWDNYVKLMGIKPLYSERGGTARFAGRTEDARSEPGQDYPEIYRPGVRYVYEDPQEVEALRYAFLRLGLQRMGTDYGRIFGEPLNLDPTQPGRIQSLGRRGDLFDSRWGGFVPSFIAGETPMAAPSLIGAQEEELRRIQEQLKALEISGDTRGQVY